MTAVFPAGRDQNTHVVKMIFFGLDNTKHAEIFIYLFFYSESTFLKQKQQQNKQTNKNLKKKKGKKASKKESKQETNKKT